MTMTPLARCRDRRDPVAERLGRTGWPAIAAAWRDLAARAAEPNVFLDPAFLQPHAACFAPGAELVAVHAPGASGRLIGLAPLVSARLGSGLFGRVAAVWASDYAPLGVPLLDAGDPVAAWAGILAAAARTDGVLVLQDMPLAGPAFQALQCAAAEAGHEVLIVETRARAALAGGRSAEEHLAASLDRKHRKDYARLWRRLEEKGRLEADTVVGEADVTTAFRDFVALEDRGWKGRAGTALARLPEARAFAESAVAGLARGGRVAIDRLRLDGETIAAVVCLSAGGTVWPWKTAYAENLSAFSPGVQVMLKATARMLETPGFRQADSLAVARHPMIDHLWRERLEVGTVVVDLGATTRARLVAADMRAWAALQVGARAARDRIRRELRQIAPFWSTAPKPSTDA